MNNSEFLEKIGKALSDKYLPYINIPLDLDRFKVVITFVENGKDFSDEVLCKISPLDIKRAFYWVRSKVCLMKGCCSCNIKPHEWIVIYYAATLRVLYQIDYDPKADDSAINSSTIDVLESYGLNNTKF